MAKQLSVKRLRTPFLLLLFLLVSLIVGRLIVDNGRADYPANTASVEIQVDISQGETGTAIAQNLAALHVVERAGTLIDKLIRGQVIGIAPGIHIIQTHIPSSQAIVELLDQKRIKDVLLVLPGSTEGDVLAKLRSLSSLIQHDGLSSLHPRYANLTNSLEGQLAPNQYSFAPGTTTHGALSTLIQSFSTEVAPLKLDKGYKGFSPYQVLTIASMIQIEGDLVDYTKIARVIYNRLHSGMPLQLNSTVQYAQGLRGEIGLAIKSTKIDSLYNTYLHTGLPPTPICNPSLAAISAAMNPASGNWIYFITVKPHDTRFTDNFPTFESWVALYNQNVAAGAFK